MCAVTCVYEGQSDEVDEQERRLNELAEKFQGVVRIYENELEKYKKCSIKSSLHHTNFVAFVMMRIW